DSGTGHAIAARRRRRPHPPRSASRLCHFPPRYRGRTMKRSSLRTRTLAVLAVIAPLLGLFFYVALRSGPLAPVPVSIVPVTIRPITPALFGIGTVEARFTYKIGPTSAGRIKRVEVNAGDRVRAGQILGEMDGVDLDD